MSAPEKTVFISYRRQVSRTFAVMLFRDLNRLDYDVFLDTESIGSGKFEEIILSQIAARAHFIVLITEGTLDRCTEHGDWLRREIEYAIDLDRNIIPVLVEGFDIEDGREFLTGKLRELEKHNGLSIYDEYFDAGLEKLCDSYLSNSDYGDLRLTPPEIAGEVKEIIETTEDKPEPTENEKMAQTKLLSAARAARNGHLNEAIKQYTEVIEIDPNFYIAYFNRGSAHIAKKNYDKALLDFNRAIEIDSSDPFGFFNRATVYMAIDLEGNAEQDLLKALELAPELSLAHVELGDFYLEVGDLESSMEAYNRALEIEGGSVTYSSRALVYYEMNKFEEALADLSRAIEIDPELGAAYNNRGYLYFLLEQYDNALKDYNQANALWPAYPMTLGGLAITHNALGNEYKAERLWDLLVGQDDRFLEREFIAEKLNWRDSSVDEAMLIVDRLTIG